MDLQEIINELRKKYETYNIEDSVYEDAVKTASEKYSELADIKFEAEKLVSKYIVEEIKKDNIDYQIILIDKYQFLKRQLSVKPKYKPVIADIGTAYEQAVENLSKSYDEDKLLSVNILDNMRIILDKKLAALESNNVNADKIIQNNSDEIYDLSFIKPYIGKRGYVLADFANDIKISYLKVDDYLYGKKKATEDQLEKLYRRFNVTEYNSLKDKILMLLNTETVTTEKVGEKRNVSYLKEYIKYYPNEKEKLKRKLNYNDEDLDNVLKGKLFVDKDQFNILLKYFNVANEKHLIKHINKLVTTKKKKQETKIEPKEDKKDDKIKTIYEYVGAYNYDVEKVDVIISFILTDDERIFLRRIYGDNLHIINNKIELTEKEKDAVMKIIDKIQADFDKFDKIYAYDSYQGKYVLRNSYSTWIKNIYERVGAKSQEEIKKVDIIIKLVLDEKEKILLKKIYGEDLKNPKRPRPLSKTETKDLDTLITKIRTRLNKFDKYFEFDGENYTLIKKEEKTKSNEKKEKVDSGTNSTTTKSRKVKNIYERVGAKTEDEIEKVDIIIELALNEEDKELLKIAYGEDLKNTKRKRVLTIGEQNILDKLIQKIKNRLNKFDTYFKLEDENYILITKEEKNKSNVIVNNSNSTINKIKSIYERIGSKTEEEIEKVDIIIELALNEEDKELLKIAYGEDLKNPNRKKKLTISEQHVLDHLIQKIRIRLKSFDSYFKFDGENYNLIKKGRTSKKKVVSNLENEENINIEDNDIETISESIVEEEPKEEIWLDDEQGYNIQILNEYLFYYPSGKKHIAESLGITEDEFEKYLNGSKLVNEEQMKAVCTFFGVDNYNKLTKRLDSVRMKESKTRYKQLNSIEEKIDKILTELSEEGDTETINQIYNRILETGLDVTHFSAFKNNEEIKNSNDEKITNKQSTTKVTLNKTKNENNKVPVLNDIKASSDIKQSYKTILDSLKSPEYKEIFKYLNYEQITAASLLLVYNHSVSKVAELLNTDEKTVVKDCELVLEFYRKYINKNIDDTIEKLKNEMVLYTLNIDEDKE